jgi:hypothetical protein
MRPSLATQVNGRLHLGSHGNLIGRRLFRVANRPPWRPLRIGVSMTYALRALGAAAAVVTIGLAPALAEAKTHHRAHHYRTSSACRGSANTGTLVGAVGGGLLGHAVSSQGAGGTLVGAGAGAVAGHQIAKSNCKRKYRR